MASGERFDTRAVEEYSDWEQGDVVTPIHLSSTYRMPGIDPEMSLEDVDPDAGEFLYGRLSNPTRHAVEKQLADLENGEMGFAFASGTAAIATAIFAVVEEGDHIIAFDDLYAGTRRMLEQLFEARLGFDVTFVDAREPAHVAEAITDDTSLLWMETPTNPMIHLCDIGAISQIAAENDAILGVDNTFATPYFQKPLELGADVVAHSTTKYMNGHSDGVGGALVTDDPHMAESIEFNQQVGLGNQMPPFDAYLLSRGLKTMGVRMRQHQENTMELAQYLDDHDCVTDVYYPGLESHPQSELASEQMDGYSGVLSFELTGDIEAAQRFLNTIETMNLAVSLGGVETLVNHPATMTHEPLGEKRRAELGITDSLLRISVGIEDIRDLKDDFERGFQALETATTP
ncbi:trans-sulfuration enzyme family protein [Halovenus rubra]|uniref:Trans-sulfuration enzyme family protein n=2 Tax=Halovenus rubra TaxID=869890 RepID=A0ABD5X6H7_9EURY|nr:PLP-dependent aspartate aminotransferase family protein [Halovenus rubra]